MSKYIDWGAIYGDGEIIGHCDDCGEEEVAYRFEEGDIDYREAQAHLKEMGWISRKIDGEWHDFCPKCRHKHSVVAR